MFYVQRIVLEEGGGEKMEMVKKFKYTEIKAVLQNSEEFGQNTDKYLQYFLQSAFSYFRSF